MRFGLLIAVFSLVGTANTPCSVSVALRPGNTVFEAAYPMHASSLRALLPRYYRQIMEIYAEHPSVYSLLSQLPPGASAHQYLRAGEKLRNRIAEQLRDVQRKVSKDLQKTELKFARERRKSGDTDVTGGQVRALHKMETVLGIAIERISLFKGPLGQPDTKWDQFDELLVTHPKSNTDPLPSIDDMAWQLRRFGKSIDHFWSAFRVALCVPHLEKFLGQARNQFILRVHADTVRSQILTEEEMITRIPVTYEPQAGLRAFGSEQFHELPFNTVHGPPFHEGHALRDLSRKILPTGDVQTVLFFLNGISKNTKAGFEALGFVVEGPVF